MDKIDWRIFRSLTLAEKIDTIKSFPETERKTITDFYNEHVTNVSKPGFLRVITNEPRLRDLFAFKVRSDKGNRGTYPSLKQITIGVHISTNEWEELRHVAEERGISLSSAIREAVTCYIAMMDN